jgi:hypothetical protein
VRKCSDRSFQIASRAGQIDAATTDSRAEISDFIELFD